MNRKQENSMIRILGSMDDYILQYKMQKQAGNDIKKIKVHPIVAISEQKGNPNSDVNSYQEKGVSLEFSEVLQQAQEKFR